MTKTTAMTSAAIAMVRVFMAVSVYLIAPGASPRIWRLGELERAGRSEPPGGAVDGHGPAELPRLVMYLAPVSARVRTLARFLGLAHLWSGRTGEDGRLRPPAAGRRRRAKRAALEFVEKVFTSDRSTDCHGVNASSVSGLGMAASCGALSSRHR